MTAGAAVVIGSAACVWDDLRQVPTHAVPWAVNDMVLYAPEVKHAVSHHPDRLLHWLALRIRKPDRTKQDKHITTHSSVKYAGIHRVWPNFHGGGSSSFLAVRCALASGFNPVYVAGVPLDASPYVWADPALPGTYDFARYRKPWETEAKVLRGKVFGISGFLRDLLGGPIHG